ncbi:MAG: hypothetical protein ACK4OM_03125 [Alphaproteobacteria bacterium]
MKVKYLDNLKSLINFIIGNGYYAATFITFWFSLQIIGLSLNYIASFNAINYAISGLLYAPNLLLSTIALTPSFLNNIPVIGDVVNLLSITISLTFSALKILFRPVIAGLSTFLFTSEQRPSRIITWICSKLEPYRDIRIIGTIITELLAIIDPLKTEGRLTKLINAKIDHYKTHSLTPFFVSLTSAFTTSTAAYFTLSLLPVPILPAIAQIAIFRKTFNAQFNNGLGKKIDQILSRYSYLGDKIFPASIIASSLAPIFGSIQIAASYPIASVLSKNILLAQNITNAYSGWLTSLINITNMGQIAFRWVVRESEITDPKNPETSKQDRKLSATIFEGQIERLKFAVGATFGSLFGTFIGIPFAPALLYTSLYTGGVNLVIGASSLIYMYKNEPEEFKKYKNNAIKFSYNNLIPPAISNLSGLGFAMLGAFIGHSLPMQYLSPILSLSPMFINNISVLAAGVIGFIKGKELADNYCEQNVKLKEEVPKATPPIALEEIEPVLEEEPLLDRRGERRLERERPVVHTDSIERRRSVESSPEIMS